LLTESEQPTPSGSDFYRIKAGHFGILTGVYMALHPMKRTAGDVAIATGGLLPHLFTLAHRSFSEGELAHTITETSASGFFLLRGYPLSEIFPLGSMVPCGARTFLPPPEGEER